MNLFDSIGLDADPFSTSPNVDLFYPAVEHRQCLEGLELAIRMRRGHAARARENLSHITHNRRDEI